MLFKRITIIGITIHIATMGITMLIDTMGTVTTVTGSGGLLSALLIRCFATLAAIRRASSLLSILAAERRPGSAAARGALGFCRSYRSTLIILSLWLAGSPDPAFLLAFMMARCFSHALRFAV